MEGRELSGFNISKLSFLNCSKCPYSLSRLSVPSVLTLTYLAACLTVIREKASFFVNVQFNQILGNLL